MTNFFKNEAKFLLFWLLGIPLFLMAVGFVAAFLISRRH
jgi:hypothetical protein